MSAASTVKQSGTSGAPNRGRADLARLRAGSDTEIVTSSTPELAAVYRFCAALICTVLLTTGVAAQAPRGGGDSRMPAAYAEWLGANARTLGSLTDSRSFSDLAFLDELLQSKSMVILGESAHGSREFNQAKVRLVKYLHEKLGFDVLVFESSFYDCFRANQDRGLVDAEGLLRSCLYPVWHTEEILELFRYVVETGRTANPLRLAGMDIQETTAYSADRAEFVPRIAGRFDPARARRIRAVDSMASALIQQQYSGSASIENFDSLVQLRAALDSSVQFFDSLLKAPLSAEAMDSVRIARETASALALFSTFRGHSMRPRSTYVGRMRAAAARDSGMADKVRFLHDEQYGGSKLMIWAHNAHIMKDGMAIKDPAGLWPSPPFKVMGTLLAESHGSMMYTVGLHMGSGTVARNDRSTDTVTVPDPGSLEAILGTRPGVATFVDLSRARRSAGTEWMFAEIVAKQWGYAKELQILRDQYDGLLFLPFSQPPQFLPFQGNASR